MNQRLVGWQLVLAVLVPAVIIALAIWFLIQALGTDDGTQALDSRLTPTVTAVPTAPAQTDELSEPTAVPSPTPMELPTALPQPQATAVATAEATTAPTSAPVTTQPTRAPAGPTATPTVDPTTLTIACGGDATFPATVSVGAALEPVAAVVSPPEAAASHQFLWNFGNGRIAGAPNAGSVTYDTEGTYTVTLTATHKTTQAVTAVTCGTVTVGAGSGSGGGGSTALAVSCRVRPVTTTIKWADATVSDNMRVTTSWTPKSTILNLQYEFPIPEPIVFSNGAETGDNMTYIFGTRSAQVKIFWRNPDTGATGRISCPAFTDGTTTTATVTPTPTTTTYSSAVSP